MPQEERSIIRSAFLRKELSALRIEVLAREALNLDALDFDWSERPKLGLTEDVEDKVRQADLPLSLAFCHPQILTERPYMALWYRGLSMMSRKELPGDMKGPEEHGKSINKDKAKQLSLILNRHICAVLSIGGKVDLATLKGIVYSTVGATLQGKWGNEIGRIQIVFEELVLDQLHAMAQLMEVQTQAGWGQWPAEGRVGRARLRNGYFVEFSANPDVAVYNTESVGQRTLVCAMEVKGGTDPSNAYYRLGDAAETFTRSRHLNDSCFNILISECLIAPVVELLKKEPYVSLVDGHYALSQLLSDDGVQAQFVRDIQQVLKLA